MFDIYTTTDGSAISLRKASQDATFADGTPKAPMAFVIGRTAKVNRVTVDAETLTAWASEADAAKRADILKAGTVKRRNGLGGIPRPSVDAAASLRAIADRDTLVSRLAVGILVIASAAVADESGDILDALYTETETETEPETKKATK